MPVHPNREAFAIESEDAGRFWASRSESLTDPTARNVAAVIAQLCFGRAVALRGPLPVQIPNPDGGEPLMTHADGRIEKPHG